MKVKITPHDKSQKKYAKVLEDLMNADINTPITQDIAMTITSWELMLGKEMVQELLKVYLKKDTK